MYTSYKLSYESFLVLLECFTLTALRTISFIHTKLIGYVFICNVLEIDMIFYKTFKRLNVSGHLQFDSAFRMSSVWLSQIDSCSYY